MADDQAGVVRIPEPFDEFYRQEYRPMVTLAYAMTGRWDVAEDLAQEGFLRAHRDWARVGGFEYPGAWMRRVVTNLAMSRFRRLRAEAAALLRLGKDTIVPAIEPPHEAFWSEVRRLPRRQRQVVVLRYVEDRTVADIAGILGIAEGTVKALLHQGRERLRARLDGDGL